MNRAARRARPEFGVRRDLSVTDVLITMVSMLEAALDERDGQHAQAVADAEELAEEIAAHRLPAKDFLERAQDTSTNVEKLDGVIACLHRLMMYVTGETEASLAERERWENRAARRAAKSSQHRSVRSDG